MMDSSVVLENSTALQHLEAESKDVLRYIEAQWDVLRANARAGHHDAFSSWTEFARDSCDGHLDDLDQKNPYVLYLPNDFITPGGRFSVQFYWDSYFILLGLLSSGRVNLARGMVENCLYLVRKHGMVIANRKRWSAGSQLPFLSKMVRAVYEVTRDRDWLAKAVPTVIEEYRDYWTNNTHLLYRGLSRYHAPQCYPSEAIAAITIDHEATWDLSPRFEERDVLDLLPIDLNCNLAGYENDLSHFQRILGDEEDSRRWSARSAERTATILDLMWDQSSGLFFDFDVARMTQKKVRSLATFFPLFHGLASEEQAAQVRANLPLFERPFGLSTCDTDYGFYDRQWNNPIGWAPLHWIVYRGLKKYGYTQCAENVALNWMALNRLDFSKTGQLFEKYDVEVGSSQTLTDRYKNQPGFGWTNAVYLALYHDLLSLNALPGL